jgi:hypothetical protein
MLDTTSVAPSLVCVANVPQMHNNMTKLDDFSLKMTML